MDNINREVIQPAAEHVSPGEIAANNGVDTHINPVHPESTHAQEANATLSEVGVNIVGLNVPHTDQPQVELPQPNIENSQPTSLPPRKPLLFGLIELFADLFKNTHSVTQEAINSAQDAYKLETKGVHHIGNTADVIHKIEEKKQSDAAKEIEASISQNNIVNFPNTNPIPEKQAA